MLKRLIILPFAETDIKETVAYFKEVRDALNHDFIHQAIDASFFEILSNPLAFPITKYDIRKFVMAKFPFCIYFVDKNEACIFSLFFTTREIPKIGKDADWGKSKIESQLSLICN